MSVLKEYGAFKAPMEILAGNILKYFFIFSGKLRLEISWEL